MTSVNEPVAHTHGLRHTGAGLRITPTVRYTTLAVLVIVAAATVAAMIWLWPDYDRVAQLAQHTQYQADGVDFEQARIVDVSQCTEPNSAEQPLVSVPADSVTAPGQLRCLLARVELLSGPDRGSVTLVEVRGNLVHAGLAAGQRVELFSLPAGATAVPATQSVSTSGIAQTQFELVRSYTVSGIMRHIPLAVIAVAFIVAVLAIGRLRGLLALAGLMLSGLVVIGFVVPALLSGRPALAVGLVGASAIMFAILFLVHGPNLRTASALIGTLAGVVVIAVFSWVTVRVTHLSGVGDETDGMIATLSNEIDVRGLISCSVLIAGLGVLNDVTITQASSVWELRSAAPELSRRNIYLRAMRIGRDHIASTVYTVCFAYAGAAIGVMMLLYLYHRPMLSLLTQEDIAVEIVRTLVGSIGLVLAAPVTTAVAVLFVTPQRASDLESAAA